MTDVTAASPAKPGIRTTEFWGKTLLQLVLILNMLFGLGIDLDHQTSMGIVAALEGVYNVTRGMAKKQPRTSATLRTETHNHPS